MRLVTRFLSALALVLVATMVPFSDAAADTLWAWGANSFGEFGDGTTVDSLVPRPGLGGFGFVALSEGTYHTVALSGDGIVWTWGRNNYGQLGDGTTTDRSTPLGVLWGAIAIATGADHSVALRADGTVWTWGSNRNGSLGDGTEIHRSTPAPVAGLPRIIAIGAGGTGNTYAISETNDLYVWGSNFWGQVGDGGTANRLLPVFVMANVRVATGGLNHTMVIRADGSLWAWGKNIEGQLGDGTQVNRSTPTPVVGLGSGVIAVSGGNWHSLALTADGNVWTWGWNVDGQLGDGGIDTIRTVPALVPALEGGSTVAITAGLRYNLALKASGVVKAWGENSVGQIGDGTTVNRLSPIERPLPSPVTIIPISAGGSSFAITP